MQANDVIEFPKEFKPFQRSFSGGFRRIEDPTKLKDDEFYLLINGRCRDGIIKPVNNHLEITKGIPSEYKLQGLYGADNILLAFASGYAYVKDLKTDSNFTKLSSFGRMNHEVDFIYAELVPGSFKNYRTMENGRILVYNGMISGVVVQDGINRPKLIQFDGLCREIQDYEHWNDNNREYVPIGKKMAYINGILYVVAPNNREIYRSVLGRPLDFVVAIDTNGQKVSTIESEGGAPATSHKVDYESIVDISRINSRRNSLFVSTRRTSYLVTANFDETHYAEPTFDNTFLFSIGSTGPFSIIDVRGDMQMIELSDIISFNDAINDGNEGRNESFAKDVSSLFENIQQTTTAAVLFNDYGLFGVNTIFGPGILVFDNKLKKWSSLDLLDSSVGLVKKFEVVPINGIKHIFFITTQNRLFEAYAGSTTANCKLYTREWTTEDPQVEHQPQVVCLVLNEIEENGEISVTPFVDRQKQVKLTEIVEGDFSPITYPQEVPYGNSDKDSTKNVTFSWVDGLRTGWKTGLLIEWNFKSSLSNILLQTSPKTSTNTIEK